MKKLALFIFVFSLACVMFSTFFKSQYMTFSHRLFGDALFNLNEAVYSFDGFLKGRTLKAENEELKKQLSGKSNIEAENKILKKENEELRQSLRLNNNDNINVKINAQITDINTLSSFSLTIDKGESSGVSLGDVCVWGKALVGCVTQVFSDFSIVTPIIAPDSTVGIMNTKGDAGIISGDLSLWEKNMCNTTFFSDNAENSHNETIVTSGFSDIYPKGLTVGKIHIENNSIKLLTEVDFFKIRSVSLISPR